MKKSIKSLVVLLLVGLILVFAGCKTESDDPSDTAALASVTNLVATAKDKSVLLTWTDAIDTDKDIYGYEVSWTSGSEGRAATSLSSNNMLVAQGNGGVIVTNLTNGTEYTFTVKTVDTNFNKSDDVTVKATPVENPSADTMKITLSVPETKSKTNITVTANIITEVTVKKVVYKQTGSINAAKLFADADAKEATVDANDSTKWTFTITATDETANGTYTVAALDNNGREEISQIKIDNFDFTGPAKVIGVTRTYSADDSTITLNWTNPTDEDFDHVEICYTINNGLSNSEKTAFETATETTKSYTNIDSTIAYYTFYLVSVDKLGNIGSEKVIPVGVKTKSLDNFVLVPAVSIKGTETWTPTSEVFVSGRPLKISSFYMCDHEVTQEEFKAVMGGLPSTSNMASTDGTADNNPVNYVNWYHAIAYCNKLSIKEGLDPCYALNDIDWENLKYSNIPADYSYSSTWYKATCDFTKNGYRLPTEAEWEWAARGGENYTFAGSNNIEDVAWDRDISDGKTHEVKTKKANGYDLYDMSGNVWEWCWDVKEENLSSSIGVTGPTSVAKACNNHRVIVRGGSWKYSANYGTVSYRKFSYTSYSPYNYLGFRVVRNAQ